MNKKEIAKHMVMVGIFTLATTFFVVSLQSYRNLIAQKEEIGRDLNLDLIDPSIPPGLLDQIQSRKEHSFGDIKIATPTPTATATPTVTPVLEVTPDQEAPTSTPSGQPENE